MAADGPPRTNLVSLDSIASSLATGATLGGVRVVRIVFEMEDGGVFDRKFAIGPTAEQREQMSQQEEDIVQTLKDNKKPLTRKQISTLLDLDSTTGRFGQSVRNLLASKRIFEANGKLTDDQSKFDNTS